MPIESCLPMTNELIFVVYTSFLAVMAIIASYLGQSALIAFCSLLAILANLFVLKTITLFGFTATASDSLIMASTLSFTLLQERYGESAARQGLLASFFCIGLYTVCCYLHILYIPSSTDTTSFFYKQLFVFMPRIMAASCIAYVLSQGLNYQLFKFMSVKSNATLSAFVSAALSQLIDTVLFAFLGLYGVVQQLGQIIIVSYCIKLTALLCMGPVLRLLLRYTKSSN